MKHSLGLFLVSLLALSAVPEPPGWQVLFRDDFESGNTGNWQIGQVQAGAEGWQLEREGDNSVLCGRGESYLVLQSGQWGDYRLSARVKLFQGALQLFYRLGRQNACPWYILAFDASGMSLHRQFPCGTVSNLPTVRESHATGRWYRLDIVGVGTNVKIYRDGVLQIDLSDAPGVGFGTIALKTMPNSHAHFDDIEVAGPPSGLENLKWVKTGGPLGGVGYDIRMRLDNPDVLYVTDTFSGVHLSTDGGRTWRASNQGITARAGPSGDAIPVFCLTIDPRNPDIVWAGTQNLRGLYKSTDGGRTWTPKIRGIAESTGISFRGITVDPRDSNTVYAMGEISSGVWAGAYRTGIFHELVKGVVYKSTDGGENWTAIWRGDNLARYLLIDPRNPDVQYISTGIFDREAANSDPARNFAGGVGILKTSNGGRSWRALNRANGLENLYIGSLFMHPANPDILLAAAGVNGYREGSGVYLSRDGGETWRKTLSWVLGGTVYNFTSVEFATSDPRIAYAGSESSIFRSEDGGETWKLVNGRPLKSVFGPDGVDGGIPIDFQVDYRNPDRLFVNSYRGGNFLTEDGGRTWVSASRGYTGAQLHRVAVVPGDWERVYTIGRNGAFRSLDGGETWEGLNYDPAALVESYTIVLHPTDPERVLASSERHGTIFLSTDGGRHWRLAFQHPELRVFGGPNGFQGFRTIVFSPSNPQTIYAGLARQRQDYSADGPGPSFGIYQSPDGGLTWREANDASTARENINVLAVDPRNESVVYAGTARRGVLRTTDAGRSWQPLNQGLKTLDVRALAIDPQNPSIIYAAPNAAGLYKSTNGGASWEPSSRGLDSQAEIQDIVINPVNSNVLYLAELRTGVYASTDGGGLWVPIVSGLSTRAVKALALSSEGGTLYAATEGEGVFRLDLKPRAEAALTAVSAASFAKDAPLAPESIASLFGRDFADPTVVFTDSGGADLTARLFAVTATQINCLVPAGLKTGPATVRVLQQNRVVARGQVRIEPVAPGLFTANADGKGAPAAVALRIAVDGSQTPLPVFQCAATCAPAAIDLGAESDQVILLLYGTGIRYGKQVSVRIGGLEAPVLGWAPQGQFVGLDQVNVRLPWELRGRGEVDVELTVDGKAANVVKVRVQ